MTQKIKKINIEYGNKTYEFIGSSLAPGESLPADTVDSAAIKDGTIQTEDLSDEVKDKMRKTYDQQDETLYMDYDETTGAHDAQPDGGITDGDDDVDDEI